MVWRLARNSKWAIGRKHLGCAFLLIRLPIAEGRTGLASLSSMGREAVFASDPIINPLVITWLYGTASVVFSIAMKMTKMWTKTESIAIDTFWRSQISGVLSCCLLNCMRKALEYQSLDNLEYKFHCWARYWVNSLKQAPYLLTETSKFRTPTARFCERAAAAINTCSAYDVDDVLFILGFIISRKCYNYIDWVFRKLQNVAHHLLLTRVSRNVHTDNACKLSLIGLMRMYPGLNGKCKLCARGLGANTCIKSYTSSPLG